MALRIERRMLPHVPWGLIGVALLIALMGIWNLASASRPPHFPVWNRQLINLGVAWAVALGICLFDYRFIQRMAFPIYLVSVGSLVALRFIGHTAKGAESWFALGPIRVEPAEFTKIAVVLMLAKFFHDDYEPSQGPYGLFQLWKPLAIIAFPTALVLAQPDLGTAMMLGLSSLTMLLFARLERWVLGVGLAALLLGSLVIWNDYVRPQRADKPFTVIRHLLKRHQSQRISGWLNPEADLRGSGYHAAQSKIAVGSGGFWGKGWRQGTQTGLYFLPEQHTDFIFSVWAEEQGFVRCVMLLALYGLLLLFALGIGLAARDRFGAFVAVGVASMVFWQVMENIGMVIGLLPVTGITLPLLSYGGSSMVSVMLSLGMLANIAMRKHVF
ncbi:MAG: rod shape-determining protein RodA [Myxococcaceae bacterium]